MLFFLTQNEVYKEMNNLCFPAAIQLTASQQPYISSAVSAHEQNFMTQPLYFGQDISPCVYYCQQMHSNLNCILRAQIVHRQTPMSYWQAQHHCICQPIVPGTQSTPTKLSRYKIQPNVDTSHKSQPPAQHMAQRTSYQQVAQRLNIYKQYRSSHSEKDQFSGMYYEHWLQFWRNFLVLCGTTEIPSLKIIRIFRITPHGTALTLFDAHFDVDKPDWLQVDDLFSNRSCSYTRQKNVRRAPIATHRAIQGK